MHGIYKVLKRTYDVCNSVKFNDVPSELRLRRNVDLVWGWLAKSRCGVRDSFFDPVEASGRPPMSIDEDKI